MIKVIIADDREFERQRLRSVVDWQLYGIELVAEARNGREAFNLCLNHKPDILITDIRMPIMDGIDLARALSSALPTLKIIFLSAYSDFEYTRQAIELNICGYVLKPYTEKDITDSIGRALEEISEYSYRKKKEEDLNSMFEGNLAELREAFLYETFVSAAGLPDKDFWNRANLLGIQFQYDLFVMVMIRTRLSPAASKKDMKSRRAEMDELIRASLARYSRSFYTVLDSTNDIAVLINIEDGLEERETQELITSILTALHGALAARGMSVQLSSSEVGYGFRSWSRLYSQVAQADGGPGPEIDQETIGSVYSQYKEIEPEIMAALRQQQCAYACGMVKAVTDDAGMKGLAAPHLLKLCLSFYCEISRLRQEIVQQKDDGELQAMLRLETTDDVCAWMQRLINETYRQICVTKESKNARTIETVIEIVQTQYHKFIDVASVSAQVYMSQNYLRTIFKEQTGQSLSDYITNYRISKACELLAGSRYRISEIPERVGLHNNPHFFFLFKKRTGYTPSEYRMLKAGKSAT